VGTYEDQTFLLYVDGVQRARADLGIDMALPANTSIQLGICPSNTDANHRFAGDIDELQVFSGAWTAEDVAEEYAARKPQADFTLPEPAAHWTFDEEVTEDGVRMFKDSGPHGWDLVHLTTNGVYATQEAVTYPETLGGKCVVFPTPTGGPYMRLKSGVTPTNVIPKGASFTVSYRVKFARNGVAIIIGDGTAGGSMRFGFEGCPRYVSVWPCSSSSYKLDDNAYIYNAATPVSAWTQITVTYDAGSKSTGYYVDGVEVARSTGTARNMNLTDVFFGVVSVSGDNVTPAINCHFDDLRIYDTALTAGEVHRMAQTYRHEDAGLTPATEVIPATSDVTVESGAKLRVRESAHAVKSLSGAGEAVIDGSATLVPGDMASFTGAVTGYGVLRLAGGVSAKTATSVTADVEIPSVVTDVAGSNLPLVSTTGKVTLPSSGTIEFSGSPRAGQIQGKTYVLAEAGSFDVPETLADWTITPSLIEGQGEPRLEVEGGKLKLKLGTMPMMIIIR